MTKIKKTLALMIVLAMAMSVLALPASAAEIEEEVTPYVLAIKCLTCGEAAYYIKKVNNEYDVSFGDGSACFWGPAHEHKITENYDWYRCTGCGADVKLRYTRTEYCNGLKEYIL